MNALVTFFAHPGRATLGALASIGRVALFTMRGPTPSTPSASMKSPVFKPSD